MVQLLLRVLLIIFNFFAFDQKLLASKNTSSQIQNIVKVAVESAMKEYQIPGVAVALYMQGEPHLFHFGYADKKKKTLVNKSTLFEIGSISKLFTCLLLAQEVLDGNMQLTDSIHKSVPSLLGNKRIKNITLEQLASHTSSLPFNAPSNVRSQKDLMNYFLKWNPRSDAPFSWEYSNHGIELIRIALEQSLKDSINKMIINRILKPLGMSPVGIDVPKNYRPKIATPYGKNGDVITHWKHPFLLGSAAICASSSDMLIFLKAALGLAGTPIAIQKAMSLTQVPVVLLKHNIKYGLGWQIQEYSNCEKFSLFKSSAKVLNKNEQVTTSNSLFHKTGTTNGFHAYIAAIPGKQTGIVIMMNRALPNGWKVVRKLGQDILLKSQSIWLYSL